MYTEDKGKFILGLIVVSLFALIQNTSIIVIYFAILFVQEIFFMSHFQNDRMIQQILMSIPLMGITVVNGIPLVNVYIALFSMYLLFIYRRNGMRKSKFSSYLVFIFTDTLRLCLFSGSEINIIGIISVPILYLCIFAGMAAFEKTNQEQIIQVYIPSFIEGVILSVLYGGITRFKTGGLLNVFVNTSIVNRNEGASGDPNYFGLYISIAVSMLILIMAIEKKYSFICFVGSCALIVMGLSSSSRMFYITSLFLIIMLIFILIKYAFNRKIFTIIAIILLLFIVLHFTQNILINNLDYVLTRSNTSNISELTNGRSDLIQDYLMYTNNNLFRICFGIGIAQYNVRSGIGAYAHNMYLELYVTMGIIGTLIVFVFVMKYIFQCRRRNKILWKYVPVIITAVSGIAVNFLEVDCFYMLFGLLFAILSMKEGNKILHNS